MDGKCGGHFIEFICPRGLMVPVNSVKCAHYFL